MDCPLRVLRHCEIWRYDLETSTHTRFAHFSGAYFPTTQPSAKTRPNQAHCLLTVYPYWRIKKALPVPLSAHLNGEESILTSEVPPITEQFPHRLLNSIIIMVPPLCFCFCCLRRTRPWYPFTFFLSIKFNSLPLLLLQFAVCCRICAQKILSRWESRRARLLVAAALNAINRGYLLALVKVPQQPQLSFR